MHELETKLHTPHTSACEVIGALRSALNLRFERVGHQCDYVFAASRQVILNQVEGTTIARVREEDAGATLTVKTRRRADLDRTELEIDIDNPQVAREILLALSLKHILTIRKTRWAAREQSRTTILVDEVEELGVFVELEVLGSGGANVDTTLAETLGRVSSALGGRVEQVHKGYDRLVLEKRAAPDIL